MTPEREAQVWRWIGLAIILGGSAIFWGGLYLIWGMK